MQSILECKGGDAIGSVKWLLVWLLTAYCLLFTMDKPHKRLIAWQKGMDLVVVIYELTKTFPREETYGLTSQIRRAAISVPSNISEGAAGRTDIQFKNFLSIAIGSLNELSTQIEIAFRVGYIDETTFGSTQTLIDECLAITFGLRKSVGSSRS